MTKIPDLPIEQSASIEQGQFMFDATNRKLARLESLIERFVPEERKIMFSQLVESIKEQVDNMRDRDQLKAEIIENLLSANSVL